MDIKVLIVDDTREMVSFLKILLESLGINNISSAENGINALQCMDDSSETFDLIFVDVHMPKMDGVEFISELASRKFTGAIAVVSSLDARLVSLVCEISRQKNLHILGCINKPATINNLKNILKKYELLFHEKMSMLSVIDKQQLIEYMDAQRLVPFFQPKINKADGKVCGFEMLARIVLPDLRTIFPDSFIPVAEANELIGRLSAYLIDLAFNQFKEFAKDLGIDCKLSINLSPIMLNDPDIIELLDSLVRKYNLQPSKIIIEITEQSAIDKVEQLETFGRLRIKGFGLSLDDYGTGYTNIQQLKSLPFTEIKIDRSLIFNICDDKVSQVIVNSILEIAKELDIEVILEGVENTSDLDYLNDLNFNFVMQGYLISKPKPVNEVHEWYQSWVSANNGIMAAQIPS